MTTFRLIGLYLFCSLLTLHAQASGSSSSSGGSYNSRGFENRSAQVDTYYEHGKTIFKNRKSTYPDFSFCIASELDESIATKIKRKNMKFLKETSVQTVAENLVNCDQPDQLALHVLNRDDLIAVIYYLNKRYKLKLD